MERRPQLTDPKGRSLKECSKLRTERNRARAKAGLKKGDPRQVDHVKPKLGAKSYDNGSSNLKVVTKAAHKKKMKNSKTETGGRPKKTTTRKKK